MPEPDSNKKNSDSQELDPDSTIKMSFGPKDVGLTQKINIDNGEIIDEKKKEELVSSIKEDMSKKNTSNSLKGKSIFAKKRITDEYIKSDSLLYVIDSIPPLEVDLKLQNVNYNYELKDKFSEGTQGIIRTAFDKSLKRYIVVKSLKGDKSEKHVKMSENLFVSEARIMAQLDHPSIVPLYGLHCGDESKLHLAMKHIHGKNLQQYLLDIIDLYEREGIENFDEKRSIATRIEYLIKICEAVDYAHCKGVIHRDIKSENIMIGNHGEVYVMDWGLGCLMKPDKSADDKKKKKSGEKTKRRGLVGTPCYIAPELIMGGPCSRQSDIFALGMVFFEIITLQRAVGGKKVNEVLKNIINRRYCQFRHRFTKIKLSNDLKAIFEKATSPHVNQRYETAHDMAEDLRLYLMREETVARPDNIVRKCIRSMINHKMITSIVILSILLCFAAITIQSLYAQNLLVHKQKERESMLANFQYDVSQKAADIERIFAHLKSQLANLAFTAGSSLSKPFNIGPPIFNMKYYDQKSTAPLDYVYSPAYDRKVSLYYTAFKLGPGVKPTDPVIRKISEIWSNLIQVFWKSDRTLKDKTTTQVRELMMKRGVTLSWVYVGLENGSMICYPGGNINKKDFDPRKLTWYKNAVSQPHTLVWSEPYLDIFSSKSVITCSRCIYSTPDKFQGVAGMDVSLDYIRKQIFRNKQDSGLKEYLLTKEGKIIISSDFNNENFKTNKDGFLILRPFLFQKEFQNATKQKIVLFKAVMDNTKYIFVFNQLPSMEFYYIQQISEKELLENWKKRFSYDK